MSKTVAKKAEPKRKNSIFYSLMAGLIILAVIVVGVVVNLIGGGEDPTPVEPGISYRSNGFYFFNIEGNTYEWAFDDYAIVNHWSDIEDYFADDTAMITAAQKRMDITGYTEEPDDGDRPYILVRVDADGGSYRIHSVYAEISEYHDPEIVIKGNSGCADVREKYDYEYWLIPYDEISATDFEINYEIDEDCDIDYPVVEKKPVIYLYPEVDTNVSVKLGAKEKLTVSYPKYIDGWNVLARPDGKLTDLNTGRELYSLYYETEYDSSKGVREDGFVVKGSDTAEFLEEKLAKLGLNEREAEEFIIFWLPQMQNNAYNYIHFADVSEIDANMPLEVSPAPTSTIRINMEWKALKAPINIKEQKLPATPERKGFTLVEWGGTILK